MSRFAEPDEPKVRAICARCSDPLYEGQSVNEYDGSYYCDIECLIIDIGLDKTEMILGEDT